MLIKQEAESFINNCAVENVGARVKALMAEERLTGYRGIEKRP